MKSGNKRKLTQDRDKNMNLKLNTDVRGSVRILNRKSSSAIKEERRRTGRYIAILVGICLFLLAIYHAWVRRIPVVASLVVPALIMFVYVAWVLFTASRDKHRLLDLEAAARAMRSSVPAAVEMSISDTHNSEASQSPSISRSLSREDSQNSQNSQNSGTEARSTVNERSPNTINQATKFIRPIILINDKPPEDLELRISNLIETMLNDKFRDYPTRNKFKRRFCRKKCAVYKRSYSIA